MDLVSTYDLNARPQYHNDTFIARGESFQGTLDKVFATQKDTEKFGTPLGKILEA
jgi:hypothetical protein